MAGGREAGVADGWEPAGGVALPAAGPDAASPSAAGPDVGAPVGPTTEPVAGSAAGDATAAWADGSSVPRPARAGASARPFSWATRSAAQAEVPASAVEPALAAGSSTSQRAGLAAHGPAADDVPPELPTFPAGLAVRGPVPEAGASEAGAAACARRSAGRSGRLGAEVTSLSSPTEAVPGDAARAWRTARHPTTRVWRTARHPTTRTDTTPPGRQAVPTVVGTVGAATCTDTTPPPESHPRSGRRTAGAGRRWRRQ